MAVNQVTGIGVNVVSASLTYVQISTNPMRQGMSIYNNSTGQMYLRFGDNVMGEWTTKIGPNHLYESTMPLFRGTVSAKWDNTVGDAHVTEFW